MISIIVSSYNPNVFKEFEASIKRTIGVPYELIQIENPGLMGICEAYNIGGQKAKFPYLCFSHEDIIFHTHNWGINLIEHFINNKELGLLGVAGSVYKPYVLSGWASSWGGKLEKRNVHQSSKIESKPNLSILKNKTPDRVITLDGCFMCTKRSIFDQIKFDQITFKDYHCYDLDYSILISQKYHVEVVYDIFFTHSSYGGYNKKWFEETIKLHAKWNNLLPYSIGSFTKYEIQKQEIGAFYFILYKIIEFKSGYSYILKLNFSKKFIKLIGFRNWFWIQLKLPKNLFQTLQSHK